MEIIYNFCKHDLQIKRHKFSDLKAHSGHFTVRNLMEKLNTSF